MAITSGYEERDFGAAFLGAILEYVEGNFEPDEVFSVEDLKEWALANGFVEGDDD